MGRHLTYGKRPRRYGADRSLWIFGGAVAVLALIGLFVWATWWNVPIPVSALLVSPPPAQTIRLPRAVFETPKTTAVTPAG